MKKISVILMVLFLLCGCQVKHANENEEEILDVKQVLSEQTRSEDITHIKEDKKESVYASADPYGNVYKTEVEVILRSEEADTIEDVSDLSQIENTKSDETFTRDGEKLIFENKGEDIHYKGLSEKPLPVNVKISYTFNGRNADVRDLAGQSGDLEIRFDYVNTTRTKADGLTLIDPFIAMSFIVLDPDVFSDVEVENGRLIEYGDMNAALIMAAPSLTDTLRLSEYELTKDLEVKDYGIIKAKVKDFHLDFTATILSNGIFEDFEEEDLDDIYSFVNDSKSFETDAHELTDNTKKLYDASIDLRSGLKEYLDAAAKLPAYLSKSSDGAKGLKEGIDQLSLFPQIKEVLDRIATEKEDLMAMTDMKIDADETLSEEAKEAKKKIFSEYITKLDEDFENAKIEESELIYLNEEILSCLKLYQTDIALRETLKKLSDGAGELQNGLHQIAQGADTLTSNNDSIKGGLDELVDAAKEFDDGMNEFVNEDLDDILKLGGSSLKNIADRIKALKKIDGNYGCFCGLKEGKSGKSVFIIETDAIGE